VGQQDNHSYEFGRFRLNVAERVLLREGELVPLTPKVFDILLVLVESSGQVVSKDDLMKRVWPNTYVEEGNLTQNISLLRKALGETPGGVQFIETVPRRGYRFVAETSAANGRVDSVAPAPANDSVVSREIPPPVSAKRRTPAFMVAGGLLVFAVIGLMYFTSKAGGNTAPIQSIAVLPFVDESADPDGDYINDKIAESLINSLSKLPQLRVVPRSVVAGYKGKDLDPRKIGQELNVRAVVTGRMRRHGDIISIQADLIDLDSVAQLWGQHYDHKVSDVMLVQDDISRDIFENLRLKLNVEEK
jgi:DNA-binding winged helix-turn-helix (wHTH) protein/TolB-like protein